MAIPENRKPVIFLAFANDSAAPLDYLKEEYKQLCDILRAEECAKLCEVVDRPFATSEQIWQVFQDKKYRDRIVIFHYAGHAEDFGLLLESSMGEVSPLHAPGFAAFLGEQHGLRLVFLNACSTLPQVQGLLDANVPAVIATSEKIAEQIAIELAPRFYKGLAGGTSIRRAYNEAVASIRADFGDDILEYYLDGAPTEDRWTWELYPKVGGAAHEWSLPEAAGDPSFGLPRIPPGDLNFPPYRHLHWFTRKHAEVFFGRGRQIRELYDLVTDPQAAPIILLYGQSGVGKSSLLEAGLIPRLEENYQIRYSRREQEHGLLGTLQKTLGPADKSRPLSQAWKALERQKPVVVILDQVEEAYTRPNNDLPDELQEFWTTLQAIFADPAQRPQGKLILGFRKEWFAEVDARLDDHDLFHQKVFLERLDRDGIIEAITGPARAPRLRKQYGLTIDDDLLAGIIADDLEADRDSPIAPMLQILLTKMWDEAVGKNRSQPRFDGNLYDDLRKNFKALDDFLRQQFEALWQWNSEVVDSGLALDVLAYHTTRLGTAEQRTVEQLAQEYRHRQEVLPEFINRCKQEYVLVDPSGDQPEAAQNTATRLAHDTLAPLVRQRFDDSDKPGQRARRILENRVVDWQNEKEGPPLDEQDLAVVERGKSGMRTWSANEERLIKASRVQRERNKRKRQILWATGIVTLLSIIIAAGVAIILWKKAERQTRVVTAQYLAAESQAALEKYPQRSLLLAVEALNVTLKMGEPCVPAAEQAIRQALTKTSGYGLAGHDGAITAVAFSQDNHWLVTGSTDGTARLWDLTAGDPADTAIVLHNHDRAIIAVAFSFDNRWLVTGSDDSTAWLWDLATKDWETAKVVLPGHDGSINAVAFSSNNRWLVTGSSDQTAILWDLTVPTPTPMDTLSEHSASIRAVAFSQNNRWLVTASNDHTARLWDLTNLSAQSKVLQGHKDHVTAVAISPNNHWLVTGSEDSTARLWDLTNLTAQPKVLHGHQGSIYAVAISQDNHWLVTGSEDHKVRLWDLNAKDAVTDLRGHDAPVNAVAFSPNNQFLATGSSDRTARLWDLTVNDFTAEPIMLRGHSKPITSVAISQEIRSLITGSEDHTVRLWRQPTKDPAAKPVILDSLLHPVKTIAISPDDRWLVIIGSEDNTARLWKLNDMSTAANPKVLNKHDDWVTTLAFSSDSRWLVTGSADHTARLWDLTDNNLDTAKSILRGHTNWVTSVAISPNKHWLATGSRDRTARLWDLTEHNPNTAKFVLRGHTDGITTVAISSDNHWLVTASSDNTARLWDLTADDPAATSFVLRGHQDPIYAVAFSPDNHWLITGSVDFTARLWDLTAQNPAADSIVLRGHQGSIHAVAISPDNKRLVTGSVDGTARLWDLTAEDPAVASVVLSGRDAEITAVAISSDNRWLVTCSRDNTVRLWRLQMKELIDLARRTAGRNLTHAEWTQ